MLPLGGLLASGPHCLPESSSVQAGSITADEGSPRLGGSSLGARRLASRIRSAPPGSEQLGARGWEN